MYVNSELYKFPRRKRSGRRKHVLFVEVPRGSPGRLSGAAVTRRRKEQMCWVQP